MNSLQLFVPTYRVDEVLAEIRVCLEKGWTGAGFKTVEFENAWKEYSGLPHAHFVNSATAGLHLALCLLKQQHGWEDGDEVITTPLTFISTNHAILYNHLTPVFADVDEYLTIDPSSMEALITPRTRCVMFVGMGGNVGRYLDIVKLCREKGIAVVLDAAHMAGTRIGGEQVGREADTVVFSFQAVKNLPTADSGMLCMADYRLDEEARKLAWMGINKDTYTRSMGGGSYKWNYDVEMVGFKAHGNSIMAAMGLVGLRYLDQDNAYRRQVAAWYDDLLPSEIKRVPMAECVPSRHLYQIRVQRRDEMILALNQYGIYPGVHYRDNTCYRMYSGNCPNARKASDELITLPIHVRLSYEDVKYICQAVSEVSRK